MDDIFAGIDTLTIAATITVVLLAAVGVRLLFKGSGLANRAISKF